MGRVSWQAGRRAACGHTEVRVTTSEGLSVPDMDSRWRARHWSLCKMAKQVVSGREFVFPLEVRNNSHTDDN